MRSAQGVSRSIVLTCSLLLFGCTSNGADSRTILDDVPAPAQHSTTAGSEVWATDATAPEAGSAGIDWNVVSDLLGSANVGDALTATSPYELAQHSEWVLTGTLYAADTSRSFATRANPTDIKYSTLGFRVGDVQQVGGTSETAPPQEVIVEVISPQGPDLERLLTADQFTPAHVIVFGNDFTTPDPATTVAYGSVPGVLYVAAHAQGFAVEHDGTMYSIADGLGDSFSSKYGLRTVDDAVAWLWSDEAANG